MALISFIFSLAIFLSVDFSVDGSECCKGYTDRYGDWKSAEWCSDYCCEKSYSYIYSTYSDLECCDSFLRRADYDMRLDTCAAWWTNHAWVPVLVSIGCIAAISLCCFGCFKLCTNNNNRTGVLIQNPQQPAVIMMATPNQGYQPYPSSSVQNPAAYPPGGAFPGGPPPYDSGMPQKA